MAPGIGLTGFNKDFQARHTAQHPETCQVIHTSSSVFIALSHVLLFSVFFFVPSNPIYLLSFSLSPVFTQVNKLMPLMEMDKKERKDANGCKELTHPPCSPAVGWTWGHRRRKRAQHCQCKYSPCKSSAVVCSRRSLKNTNELHVSLIIHLPLVCEIFNTNNLYSIFKIMFRMWNQWQFIKYQKKEHFLKSRLKLHEETFSVVYTCQLLSPKTCTVKV